MKLYSIKPLEWEESASTFEGGIPNFTEYEIHIRRNGQWGLGISRSDRDDFDEYYTFDSLAEAKQKAEQDWQERLSQYLTEYKDESQQAEQKERPPTIIDDSVDLPKGKTCRDCWHFERCNALFGISMLTVYCDFSPSRFILKEEK